MFEGGLGFRFGKLITPICALMQGMYSEVRFKERVGFEIWLAQP